MLTSLSLQWDGDTACTAPTALCAVKHWNSKGRDICVTSNIQSLLTSLCSSAASLQGMREGCKRHRWQKGKAWGKDENKIYLDPARHLDSLQVFCIHHNCSPTSSDESRSLRLTLLHRVLAAPAMQMESAGAAIGKEKPKSYREWPENRSHASQLRSCIFQPHIFFERDEVFAVWHQWLPLYAVNWVDWLGGGGQEGHAVPRAQV